jgi:hypothetical protein
VTKLLSLLLLLLLLPAGVLLMLLLPLLCCQAHIKLPPENAGDQLQLAFNCSNPMTIGAALCCLPGTAAAAATDMPALLQPDVARRLLLTAAMRHHHSELQYMLRLNYLQQHVDAATIEAMLEQLVAPCYDDTYADVKVLCKLPAAAQLSSKTLSRLLLAAVEGYAKILKQPSRVLGEMAGLPAAQQLSSEEVLQQLQASAQHNSSLPVPFLRLPAMQQLSNTQVMQSLEAAVNKGAGAFIESLMFLHSAAQPSRVQIMSLLETAVIAGNGSTDGLCRLPAARQLNNEAVFQLLQSAVRNDSLTCTKALSRLPAARLLHDFEVANLLEAAEERQQSSKPYMCAAALQEWRRELNSLRSWRRMGRPQ